MQIKATGMPERWAKPRAKKAADRSSKIGMASISECWANAMARGAEREPGQIMAVCKPRRCRVSAKVEAHSVLVLRKSKGMGIGFGLRVGDRGDWTVQLGGFIRIP